MYDQILHGELYIPEFVGPNATDILSKACLPGVLVQWEMFALHQFSPPDLGAFHRCPLQCQNKSFFLICFKSTPFAKHPLSPLS